MEEMREERGEKRGEERGHHVGKEIERPSPMLALQPSSHVPNSARSNLLPIDVAAYRPVYERSPSMTALACVVMAFLVVKVVSMKIRADRMLKQEEEERARRVEVLMSKEEEEQRAVREAEMATREREREESERQVEAVLAMDEFGGEGKMVLMMKAAERMMSIAEAEDKERAKVDVREEDVREEDVREEDVKEVDVREEARYEVKEMVRVGI